MLENQKDLSLPTIVSKICLVCNNNFTVKRKEIWRGGGKYCSRKCVNELQKETFKGKGNANYRHGRYGTKEYSRYHNHIRRVLKSGTCDFSVDEIKEFMKKSTRCYWCNISLTDKNPINLDHYIPLAKGGENAFSNIVASCKSCNSKKHAKDPYIFANERGRLL